MRRSTTAVIVSVCSVAIVLSLLFLYVTQFPFFHQSGVMTVGQLNTGINYWRNLYAGRNVMVRGTLEPLILKVFVNEPPFNLMLKDDLNGNGTVPIYLNLTQYSSSIGQDVVVKGEIFEYGHTVYIRAENVLFILHSAY